MSYAQQISSPDSIAVDTMGVTSYVISPITVHASKHRTPFSISSINQNTIEQLTEPTIEPLLNATAGIWMQTGALNTNRISIRGVGYREPFATTGIKIYLDEIPVTNGVGEASIEDIHPLILSGIDIWRGPASALWGSGLGGMIHLKSHIPESDSWSAMIQTGSFGRLQMDQHFSTRYGKNDQWATSLHYQFLNDDGFRDNNDYQKHSFTWIQQWRSGKGLSLNSFIHAIDLKAFIPSSINLETFKDHPSSAAPTWDAVKGNEDYTKWITGLNILYNSESGWLYRGSVFGTFFSSDEVRPFNVLDERNASYGTRHRFSFPIAQAGHITAGMEYFSERYAFSTFETLTGGVPGDQLSDEEEDRTYLNGFVQSDWTIGSNCFAFAGLSSSSSRLSNEALDADIPLDVFPTLGMSYAFNDHMSVTASLSKGYSAMSLSNLLNADGTIAIGIKPETGWSREIAFKADKGLRGYASINVFIMNIKNTIITRRIMDDVFEKINGGSTIHRGLEMEYKWSTLNQKISIEGSLTFADYIFDQFDDGGVERSGNKLPGAPASRTYLKIYFSPWDKWAWYIEQNTNSKIYLNDANTQKGDGYHLIHAGLRYSLIDKKKWQIKIAGNVHNLFDVRYASMFQINAPGALPRYYYPGKPRAIYLNFDIRYLL